MSQNFANIIIKIYACYTNRYVNLIFFNKTDFLFADFFFKESNGN